MHVYSEDHFFRKCSSCQIGLSSTAICCAPISKCAESTLCIGRCAKLQINNNILLDLLR